MESWFPHTDAITVSCPMPPLLHTGTCTILFSADVDRHEMRTYLMLGRPLPGQRVAPEQLLALPVELAFSEDPVAEYAEQARELHGALVAADGMLGMWYEHLRADRASLRRELPPPRPRWPFLPATLRVPVSERRIGILCDPTRLSVGRPRLGVVIAQGDFHRRYPYSIDPEDALRAFEGELESYVEQLADELDVRDRTVDGFKRLFEG